MRRLAVAAAVALALAGLALPGDRRAPSPARTAAGEPAPGAEVRFSLVLRTANAPALRRRLRTGRSRPLDTRAFGRRFGPPARELERVRRAVRGAGLEVAGDYPQRTQIDVRGRARDARRLLGPRLARPAVPSALRPTVTAVAGLGPAPAIAPAAIPAGGLRPVSARTAYGVDRLHRRGLLGQGETVAIVSFDSFHHEDVDEFDRRAGIRGAPRVRQVPVAGGVRPGPRQDEVNLDIDVIRGVAPKAQIVNYEAGRRVGFAPVLNRILADGRARVISISWGACELRYGAARRRADARALAAAAASGVSVFVATGDSGATDCERFEPTDHRRSVSWPSSSAHVVAVGGTLLELDGGGRYAGESGWEDVLSNAGGGGGQSRFERRPRWQRATGLRPGRARATPDVAASADTDSGWFVWYGGRAHQIGGTSAAAPFWAGSAVLAHQAARRAGAGRPPFLAPLLYRIARSPGPPFHDVVRGGNRLDSAGPGWDRSTGLGSADVGALVDRLVRELRSRPK